MIFLADNQNEKKSFVDEINGKKTEKKIDLVSSIKIEFGIVYNYRIELESILSNNIQ